MDTMLDVLAAVALVFGLFFMLVAAVGLVRLPDIYHRMHAATKGVTLGIAGMLFAAGIALCALTDESPVAVFTKVLLVILFQFVANPVGAHLLAKAAHLDRAPKWPGTLSDELDEASQGRADASASTAT